MDSIRKHSPAAFILVLVLTIGWWSGYMNRVFRYEAVIFSDGHVEHSFTEARLWHDLRGQWRVSGAEGVAVFPRASGVVMRGARVMPDALCLASMATVIVAFAGLTRWARQPTRTVAR